MQRSDGDWFDILDTRPHPSRNGFFALGCNVLAPFSNRIAGGGFWHDGKFHALDPNLDGEPYPNHGNAFSSEWVVERHTENEAVLGLHSDGPGPFRYDARVTYRLEGGQLVAELLMTNRAEISLPFGGGFHPWFARTSETELRFSAAGVWTETKDHLPDRFLPLDGTSHDHRDGQGLPDAFINVAYPGWDGLAEIAWPERGMSVRMTAEQPLGVLMLYTPGREAPFLSLEPVSHTVDAHNRHGHGVVRPLVLEPGESLRLAMQLEPRSIAGG